MKRQAWRKMCALRGHKGLPKTKVGNAVMMITNVLGATVLCARCKRTAYQGHPAVAIFDLLKTYVPNMTTLDTNMLATDLGERLSRSQAFVVGGNLSVERVEVEE